MNQLLRTRNLAIIGMLIALEIVLTRLLSIQTPVVRISFGFFAIALIGMLYGPAIGGVAAGIADVLGWSIFPTAPFHLGFTLTAILAGIIFGYFLHKPNTTLRSYIFCALSVTLICDTFLVTLWLSFLQNAPFNVILISRLLKIFIMATLYITVIPLICSRIKALVKARLI